MSEAAPTEPIPGGIWRRLGGVSVDSAHMAILDPMMGPTSGVEFMAGFGDGGYDVWGREVDIGGGDVRLVEVRVTLITEADLTEWMRS